MSGVWNALSSCDLSKSGSVRKRLTPGLTLITPHTAACTQPLHQTTPICTPDTHEDSVLLWDHTPHFRISLQLREALYGGLQFLSAALYRAEAEHSLWDVWLVYAS